MREVSKYLAKEFKKENLENDKKDLYNTISDKIRSLFIGAIFKDKIIASVSIKFNPFNVKESHVGN